MTRRFTTKDLPFVEQVIDAEMESRNPVLCAVLKDHRTDADRRLSALTYLATGTDDDDTFRWVAAQCVAMGSDGNDLLCLLARMERIPVDVLVLCARSEYLMVCERACSDGRLPEAEIRDLARTGGWGKRMGIAANPAAPWDVLADLARDETAGVRARVAQHPHTGPAAIAVLAADPDPWVRECATSLRGVPEEELMAAWKRHMRREVTS